MKRLLVIAAATAIASGSGLAATAVAAPPSPANPVGHSSDIQGVVHSKHMVGKPGGSGGNLSYHGGNVMHGSTTYAIYWVPSNYSVQTGYSTLINQYFGDVAADSGKTSNVYYSDTQYSDGAGKITYSGTFGGSWTDTTAYTNDCNDTVSATTVCVSDADIQASVMRAAAANPDWVVGASSQFFVFTAKNVGSCFDSSHCAFSYYCAYHGDFTNGSQHFIYANQPYTNTAPSSCGTGQAPDGAATADADSTINVTSHEHNEAITDPYGTAWFDRTGAENGDKCAWKFGTALGGSSGTLYNQLINGHHYYLQQEWSNAHSRCVLTGI